MASGLDERVMRVISGEDISPLRKPKFQAQCRYAQIER